MGRVEGPEVQLGWSAGHDEAARPDGRHGRMAAALERRCLSVGPVEGPPAGPVAVLADPRRALGPERVRAWRRWVLRGGRLLLLSGAGGHGPDLSRDAGLVVPGLDLPDRRLEGRVRAVDLTLRWRGGGVDRRAGARLDPPGPGRDGRLWPRGRGWFRWDRTLDVLAAWPVPEDAPVQTGDGVGAEPSGWLLLHLVLGSGEVVLVPDAAALDDASLEDGEHGRLLARVLRRWLPRPEPTLAPALAAGRVPRPPAAAGTGAVMRRLEAEGLDLRSPRHLPHLPGVAALRDLGRLAVRDGHARLTDAGRSDPELIAILLDLPGALEAADRAG